MLQVSVLGSKRGHFLQLPAHKEPSQRAFSSKTVRKCDLAKIMQGVPFGAAMAACTLLMRNQPGFIPVREAPKNYQG